MTQQSFRRVDHSSPAGFSSPANQANRQIATASPQVMGAGGAFEVSPITKHMTQLAGRDFKRNNPVRDKNKKRFLS